MKRWFFAVPLSMIALATAACGGAAAPTGGASDASKKTEVGATGSGQLQATPTGTVPGGGQADTDGVCTAEKPACDEGGKDKGSIGAGGSSVTGQLPPEVIARTVRASISQVRACYERGLKKDPALKGTVKIKFTIAADGRVANAQDDGSQLASPEVIECVRAEIRKMTFPAPDGGTVTVVYPFEFEAKP